MILDPILDLFRGKAVTIPPLDGAFRPNTVLDDAETVAPMAKIDNLCLRHGALLGSSGATLYDLSNRETPVFLESFVADISALAVSPAGELAIGLDNGTLLIDGTEAALPPNVRCITALAYGADGMLYLANGSAKHAPSAFAVDLMEKGSSGSVWRREGNGPFRCLASGLAFPNGLLVSGDRLVVAEAWKHRLIGVDPHSGKISTLLGQLPGYPARLSPAPGGGAWLALFAPRNRLVEFVLQETHYRLDMMRDVPREFWIAPSLSSGRSFLEPLQCGGIRMMGIHKPWSPSRSCGLVVRLDADLLPVTSFHSRANGTRHGVTSAAEVDGKLAVASKGGDCLITLDLSSTGGL